MYNIYYIIKQNAIGTYFEKCWLEFLTQHDITISTKMHRAATKFFSDFELMLLFANTYLIER